MPTTVPSSKTVFTADAIEYDFLPEKYAAEQSLITAELNVLCQVDWQTVIHNWYSGALDETNEKLCFGAEATPEEKQLLLQAQDVHFLQDAVTGTGLSYTQIVGSTATSFSSAVGAQNPQQEKDEKARDCIKAILHEICIAGQYYTGLGVADKSDGDSPSISEQFQSALTSLLEASAYTTTSDKNKLEIDLVKIRLDLGDKNQTSATEGMPFTPAVQRDDISITNESTARLMKLVNGWAFVPILNRLVAGGNFTAGDIDGDNGVGGASYKFDMGSTADGSGDLIDDEVHMVFPVRIKFADHSVTNVEEDGVGGVHNGTVNGVEFQLNIIFASPPPQAV